MAMATKHHKNGVTTAVESVHRSEQLGQNREDEVDDTTLEPMTSPFSDLSKIYSPHSEAEQNADVSPSDVDMTSGRKIVFKSDELTSGCENISSEKTDTAAGSHAAHRYSVTSDAQSARTSAQVDAILARRMSSLDMNGQPRPRKKTSIIPAVVEDPAWRCIGEYETLRRTKCRRLYAKVGQDRDLALFYRTGQFYALDAWCSHMRGPLYEGDIEDYKGSAHVMCPWHAYMFDLNTGMSDIGLAQQVYPVKVEAGQVYVKYVSPLGLYPFL